MAAGTVTEGGRATVLRGRCACGATEYEVEDAFVYAMNCHCSKCRAATGAAYKPMGGIEREKLRITREDAPLFVWGEADAGDFRCGVCGSFLYSIVRDGKWAHVTFGSLVDMPARLPDHHIFVGSKAHWEEIRDALPQYEGHARSAPNQSLDVAATGINHVSIPTRDLDESERFYAHLVGAERLVSPNFGMPVRWLRIGGMQIHLLHDSRGGGGPGHFAITVDDVVPVYERARELGVLEPTANGHYFWELPDGVVQLYLRDPSGNLVEVNARDASALPASVRADLRALVDAQEQSEENLRARLLP